uniref:SAM domain-containing protein n=1 Tax=Anopheles farauti TaxID=69004 RepID=A0A182QGN5_9DIPT
MIMAASLGQATGADRATIVSQGGQTLQIDRNLLPVSIANMAGNPIVVTSNGTTISPIHQSNAATTNVVAAGALQSQQHSQILVSSMPSATVHQAGQNPIVAMTSLSAAPMSVASIISSGAIPSISSGAITTTASLAGQPQVGTGAGATSALLATNKDADPKAISVAMHQLQQLSTPQKQIQQQQLLDNMNAAAAAAAGSGAMAMLGGSPLAGGTSLPGSPATSTAMGLMAAGGKFQTMAGTAPGGMMGSPQQTGIAGAVVKLSMFQPQSGQQLSAGGAMDTSAKEKLSGGSDASGKDSEQTSTAAGAAAATDSASDAQLNGTASTPMDTTPAPGTTTTGVGNTNGTGGDVTSALSALAAVASLPSLQSAASTTPTSAGITTVSSAPGTTTVTGGAVSSAPSAAIDDTTKPDATTATPTSTGASGSVASTPTSSSTTTTMTSGGTASSTTSSTSTTASTTTAIATVTGTSAIPVSNIGPNGLLSTNGSVSTAGSTATSCVTTPSTGTTGGLPPKTGSSADKGGIPKATIKPNVLTHVIEGYVIQEANEPFAVQRQRYPERDSSDEPPKKRSTNETNSSPLSPSSQSGDMGNCEVCGKAEMRSKMKRKRYCSVSCARSAKQGSTDHPIASPVPNGMPLAPASNGMATTTVTPAVPPMDSAAVASTVNGSLAGPVTTAPSAVVVDPSLGSLPLGPLGAPTLLNPASVGGVLPQIKLDLEGTLEQQQQQQQHQQMIQLQQQGLLQPTATGLAPVQSPASAMLLAADVPAAPVTPVAAAAAAAVAAANAEEGSSILRWTVQDVYEFIRGLPGCADYAEDFVNQEIDGQALLLLKENHLVSTMDMKLGPALKIVARVNLMKTTIAPADGQQQPAT